VVLDTQEEEEGDTYLLNKKAIELLVPVILLSHYTVACCSLVYQPTALCTQVTLHVNKDETPPCTGVHERTADVPLVRRTLCDRCRTVTDV